MPDVIVGFESDLMIEGTSLFVFGQGPGGRGPGGRGPGGIGFEGEEVDDDEASSILSFEDESSSNRTLM